jgi:ankyrin repeat protein
MAVPVFQFDTNNLNLQNPETGETHLHFAIAEGKFELAEGLVVRGADVNLSNKAGTSPLMIASFKGFDSTVEFLLDHGAELEAKDVNGHTALNYATRASVPILKLLVTRGASLHTKGCLGGSILHSAAKSGNVPTAEYLLEEYSALFSVDEQDDIGVQPLHCAAYCGKVEAVEFFRGRGARVDCKTIHGETPLMLAAYNGHLLVSRALLLHGANYRLLDDDGMSALAIATNENHYAVADLLRAWPSIVVVWTLRSAEQVRRLSTRTALRRLPNDLCRVVGAMLV